ncbi:hypothetical protein HDU76_010550 [Blyttiomyces sp. JEL0837]|nr:hypothetical protein HDU76_010550 [Blyttiomyces sp. JEL0837]
MRKLKQLHATSIQCSLADEATSNSVAAIGVNVIVDGGEGNDNDNNGDTNNSSPNLQTKTTAITEKDVSIHSSIHSNVEGQQHCLDTRQQLQRQQEIDEILNSGGFFTRVFGRRVFNLIKHPAQMYIVGLLFGLGFDTATEIALLAIASVQAHDTAGDSSSTTSTTPAETWLVMFLPVLFTCGMCLLDTLDGFLMLGVYGWAMVLPMKKLYYNLFMTSVSCLFAVCVALLQLLGMFHEALNLTGPFWDAIGAATGENFEFVGVGLVGTFLIGWAFASGIYYWNGYHKLEKVIMTNETVMNVTNRAHGDEEVPKAAGSAERGTSNQTS